MALKTLHINQSIQWLSKRIKSSFTISNEEDKQMVFIEQGLCGYIQRFKFGEVNSPC